MKILAAWDNESEAEHISMYLGIDENELTMVTSADAFRSAVRDDGPFDIVFMATELPDEGTAYELFELVQSHCPEAPIVGACQPSDVFRVVRFMANGMSAYVTRDPRGDFMFMLRAIIENTLDAVHAAREKELARKLREEVESVRALQESVLPKNVVAPSGYRISARYEPAQIRVVGGQPVTMAGGDYYDVFPLKDGNVALLVGDATGHGMKSCLSIMTVHTLVCMMRRQEFRDTAHFVSEINKVLCEQTIVTEKGGFITLLYAILDHKAHTLQWSSAGHQPPLLQNLTTGKIELLADASAGGLPLAVDEDSDYESYVCNLPENFRLLLYTDGLEEAYPGSDDKNHFGLTGITKALADTANKSSEEAIAYLYQASDDFTQGSGREDDTSVVLLERRS